MKRSLTIGLVLCAFFAGCGRNLDEAGIPYVAGMLDNLLSGIGEQDYAKFSRDFSPAMKDALKEDGFPGILSSINGDLGEYRERAFMSAGRTRASAGEITVVTYRAVFSKNADARIRVWISEKEGVRRIEGFMAGPAGDLK